MHTRVIAEIDAGKGFFETNIRNRLGIMTVAARNGLLWVGCMQGKKPHCVTYKSKMF